MEEQEREEVINFLKPSGLSLEDESNSADLLIGDIKNVYEEYRSRNKPYIGLFGETPLAKLIEEC